LKIHATSALILLALAGPTLAQPGADAEPLDWKALEAHLLSGHVQITSRDQFVKAGEAYFSPDSSWITFQAVPLPTDGARPDDFYSMYVAKIRRDEAGAITGTDDPILISPPGSANTCGWFHPHAPWRVLFGSTITPPATDQRSGFQVGTRRYVWLFPQETKIVSRTIVEILDERMPDRAMYALGPDAEEPVTLVGGNDYHAEASWSPCGRFILYAAVRPERTDGRADADLWIYDTQTQQRHPIVVADGYDGGPFFSPDGRRICYRSDRQLNDRLQIFVADLKFEDGVPVGIEREYQLTDNEHVNWAPYWHPSGEFLIYTSSEVGHWNYEVFAVQTDVQSLRAGATKDTLWHQRITSANGADVLPVFNHDGTMLMWTAQRGPLARGERSPSSQLWVANIDIAALRKAAEQTEEKPAGAAAPKVSD
jgi:TolB protein